MSRKIRLIPTLKKALFTVALVVSLGAQAKAEEDPDPSAGIFIRVYKQADGADPDYRHDGHYIENDGVMSNHYRGLLEVWAWSRSEKRYKPYKSYPVPAYRGWLGPKTRQGDHQAPEGFYTITRLNPNSKYGRGLWIDYPNNHDRRQKKSWTGGDLEIHGDYVSDGCLAMEDQIHEIYALAKRAMKGGQKEIPLHIFPFPMTEENLERTRGHKWYRFWKNLKQGSDAFEATRIPPKVGVDSASRDYLIQPVGAALPSEARVSPPKPIPSFAKERSVPVAKPAEVLPAAKAPEVLKEQAVSIPDPLEEGRRLTSREEPTALPMPAEESALLPVDAPALSACAKVLNAFFGEEANRDEVRHYLKIQGQLALHRIAWSYLKVQNGKTEPVEKTIERLLGQRNPDLHGKFVNVDGATSARISRNMMLLNGLEALRAEVSGGTAAQDASVSPFVLKYGDIKMVNLLVEAEKIYGSGRSGGVIDFVNMINSSYRGKLENNEAHLRIAEKTMGRLSAQMNTFAEKVQRYMSEHGCAQPMDAFACSPGSGTNDISRFSELLQESVALQDGLFSTLGDRIEDVREANRWGSYWLHVSGSRAKGKRAPAGRAAPGIP